MAQSGDRREIGKIGDRKMRERSESIGSVEKYFKRKRDKLEKGERDEGERDEGKRAF